MIKKWCQSHDNKKKIKNSSGRNKVLPIIIEMIGSKVLLLSIALGFRFLFMISQISAIWMVFKWYSGSVPEALQVIIGFNNESYIYPFMSSGFLIAASLSAFAARKVSLISIRQFISAKEKNCNITLSCSEYKGAVKFLLASVDALVPSIFIAVMCCVWSYNYPFSLLFLIPLLILLGLFLRKLVKRSIKVLRPNKKYMNDDVDKKNHFFNILMLPQYVIICVYTLLALSIFCLSVVVSEYGITSSSVSFIFVGTVVAIMQLKSSVGLVVRMSAYFDNLKKLNSSNIFQ